MYAECSDFFYVWLKRTLAGVYPDDWFAPELTEKDEEAIANDARFAELGSRKKRALADTDYEKKMSASFKAMHRSLAPDGVLTVMFTHREVNAWDNALFVKTVRETGKKTLIIAGVWTNVCVMFPALDAKAEGYNVYVVIDASGDPSEIASRTTLARFTQAGVIPTSTNAVTCELHRTWNRHDAAQLAELYCMASPSYQAVMESFNKAQEVARQPKK